MEPDPDEEVAFESQAPKDDSKLEDDGPQLPTPEVLVGHPRATQYTLVLQQFFAPYDDYKLVKLQDYDDKLILIAFPVLGGKKVDPVLVKLCEDYEANEVQWGLQVARCAPNSAAQVRGTRKITESEDKAAGLVVELLDACWCVPDVLASEVQMLTSLRSVMRLAFASEGAVENPGGGTIVGNLATVAPTILASLVSGRGLVCSLLASSDHVVRAEDPIFCDGDYNTKDSIQLHTMGQTPGYPNNEHHSLYAKRFKKFMETLDSALWSREGDPSKEFGKARAEMRKLRAAVCDLVESWKKNPGLGDSWKPVCALTHGSLYASNLVVDLFQHIWCIDYSLAQQSPALKDLGKLIASLIFDCNILPIALEDLVALLDVEDVEANDLERWFSVDTKVAMLLFAQLKEKKASLEVEGLRTSVVSQGLQKPGSSEAAIQRETLVCLQRAIVGSREEAKAAYQEALDFSSALVEQLGTWGVFEEAPPVALKGRWLMAWQFVGRFCRSTAEALTQTLRKPEMQPFREIDASPYLLYCPILDAALHYLSSAEVAPWQKLWIQETAALVAKAMTKELNSRIPEDEDEDSDDEPKKQPQEPKQKQELPPVEMPGWLTGEHGSGGGDGIVAQAEEYLQLKNFLNYEADQRLLYFSEYQRKWVEGAVVQATGSNSYEMLTASQQHEEVALNDLNHTPAWLTKAEFEQCAEEYREFMAMRYAYTKDPFTGERQDVKSMLISLKGSNALPPGWECAGDNGQIYYFNRQTGAVQWDFPDADDGGAAESSVQRDAWASVVPDIVAPHALDAILKPFLVVGAPASGKSSFCNRVVSECISNTDGPLPIVMQIVDLERLMSHAKPDDDIIDHFLTSYFDGSSQRCTMLKMAIRSRRALLIFDGLDEGGSRRQEFQQYITSLARLGHRIACTSRPESCDLSLFTMSGFSIMELQEFDSNQQQHSVQVRLPNLQRASDFCNRFLNAMEWSGSCGNPLVLNMLLSYSDAHNGEVSDSVGVRDIYDFAVDMVFRKITLSMWCTQEQMMTWCERAKDTLSHLALAVHVKGIRDFDDDDAAAQLEGNGYKVLQEQWADLRERITDGQLPLLSCFIDPETEVPTYRFSHLSFQEFFTANYAAANFEPPKYEGQPVKFSGFPDIMQIISDPRWSKCLTFLFEDPRVQCDTLSLRDPRPGSHLGAIGAWSLATVLQRAKAVHHVDIRGNNITDDGALTLAKALQTNQALKTLWVSENYLDPRGAVTPAAKNALRKLQETNPGLEVIFSGF